jgi:hypothetical protein
LERPPFRDQPIQAPIDTAGPSAAWLAVLRQLMELPDRSAYSLVVRMKNPFQRNRSIEGIYEKIRRKHGLPSIEGVAATIFPRSFYRFNCKSDRRQLYKEFPTYHTRMARFFGKKPAFSYFQRLVAWQAEGMAESVNQLEAFITRMRGHKAPREAWYFYPTLDPTRDLGKIFSGPCLTAVDLKYEIKQNILNLIAFYRDHEFVEKALGNYVGLGHLLEFVCEQTETKAGAIVCISLRARIESGYVKDLEGLLSKKT